MEEGISRLLLEIYSAAREAPIGTFEDRALKLMKPWLGFERSMWGTGVFTPSGLDVHSVHLHEEPEEMLLDYEEVKYQDPVRSEVFKRRGNTVCFHSPTLYQGRDKLGMLSLIKRFKHQNMLVTVNPGNSNYCQWISLYRANLELQYSEHERLLCETLVPHLMEALTINRVINMDRLGIEKRRYARGFFDRMGLLQFAEPLLTDLFQSEWPNWNNSLLPAPLFEAIVAKNGTRFLGRHIAIRAVRQNGLVFLGARKCCAADGLSARELQVARHIAAGLSHKEIACRMNIAPATARNHTQTIYGKLQVNNKANLIAELGLLAED